MILNFILVLVSVLCLCAMWAALFVWMESRDEIKEQQKANRQEIDRLLMPDQLEKL